MHEPWDEPRRVAQFRDQATVALPRSPLVAALSNAIAGRPALVRVLQHAPPAQRRPVLLLAAIHLLVIREPTAPLAAWFPTVSTDGTRSADDPALADALADFALDRTSALIDIVATRSTQTNEIGRCTTLLPALGLVADECGPLSLIDVGASAGLNLFLDRYAYEYEPGGAVAPTSGRPTVTLRCGTRGDVPVPPMMPPIEGRSGVDLHPIDVTDPDAASWLRACVWPDQVDRFDRLSTALEIARRDPPRIAAGDATALVPGEIAAVRANVHPVVTNTWVLAYFSGEQRDAYGAVLQQLGTERDLTWIFAESPAENAELPAAPELSGEHVTALTMVRWRSGRRSISHLGVAHPHGYWLHWRHDPRP